MQCSVEGCDNPVIAKGMCSRHYARQRRHGSPTAGRTYDGEPWEYFLETVLSYTGEKCLIWPFTRTADGYGQLSGEYVHRKLCEETHGPAPTPRHVAAHSCGNGHLGCCAKRHLSWKTASGNEADKVAHGTSNRGSRHGMAKLSEADVVQILNCQGASTRAATAEQFQVSPSLIGLIWSGKRWRHVNERAAA